MEETDVRLLTMRVEAFRALDENRENLQADPEADPASLHNIKAQMEAALAVMYTQLGVLLPHDDPEVVAIVHEWEGSAARLFTDMVKRLIQIEEKRRDIVMRATPKQWLTLRDSPLAWLRWLAWLLLCDMLVDMSRWAGFPPYDLQTMLLLMTVWMSVVVHGVLIFTNTISGICGPAVFFATIFTLAAMHGLLDGQAAARRADVAILAAVPAEVKGMVARVERSVKQLPGGVRSLRRVAAEFSTSIEAALALAKREQQAVLDNIYRLNRRLWGSPWDGAASGRTSAGTAAGSERDS